MDTNAVSTCEKRVSAFIGIAGFQPAKSAKREMLLSKIIACLQTRGAAGRTRSQYLDAVIPKTIAPEFVSVTDSGADWFADDRGVYTYG